MAEVTVVIPARDAAATLPRTLGALAAQELDGTFEVLVVDSGSSDATPELAAASPVVTQVLGNPGGEPASSRNLGAAHASGRVLAFTDADCEPSPRWLAAGLDALRDADLVQGPVRPVEGERGPWDRTLWVTRTGLFETANLLVTRELFERLGGFQPVFALGDGRLAVGDDAEAVRDRARSLGSGATRPFGEDVLFGWRAVRAGARPGFAPEALVRHAVFPRGARAHLAERDRLRWFPALARLVPELRREGLYRRWFLSRRSAAFDLALLAAVAAAVLRSPWPLAAGLPYALEVLRHARRWGRRAPEVAIVGIVADAAAFMALARGSVRSRSVVL